MIECELCQDDRVWGIRGMTLYIGNTDTTKMRPKIRRVVYRKQWYRATPAMPSSKLE